MFISLIAEVKGIKRKFEWREGLAEIATDVGRPITTIALRTPMIPGLCITYSGNGRWGITHEPSGRGFGCFFNLLSKAIESVEERCAGIDWYSISQNVHGNFDDAPSKFIGITIGCRMDAIDEYFYNWRCHDQKREAVH